MFCVYRDDLDAIGYRTELIDLRIMGVQVFAAFVVATITKRSFKGFVEQHVKECGHVDWYKNLKRLKELGYLKIYRKNNRNVYEIHVLVK